MVGYRHDLYMVGGRGADGESLRSCFILNLETGGWRRGPDMMNHRWYHGVCRVNNVLFAVGGCGQLNTIEALDLGGQEGRSEEGIVLCGIVNIQSVEEVTTTTLKRLKFELLRST